MLKVLLFVAIAIVQFSDAAPAPEQQALPEKVGYVPVYIRFGDQPLYEINPELAQAFHENSIRARQIKSDENSEAIIDGETSAADSSKDHEDNPYILGEFKGTDDVSNDESKDAIKADKKRKLAASLESEHSTEDESKPNSNSDEEHYNRRKRSNKQNKGGNNSSESSQSSESSEEEKKRG